MDPELEASIDQLPVLDLRDVEAARRELNAFLARAPQRLPTGVEVERTTAHGPGSTTVPVRIYRHSGSTRPTGGLLWIHGGGFVLGRAAMDEAFCGAVAAKLGATVVSVEYGLAPEHPYPAAFDQCFAALTWLMENASEIGVDPARIAIGGQSAGGALAAGVTLRLRDERKLPSLALQVLLEPVLDVRLDTPSMRAGTDTPLWNRANAALSWEYYLGGRRATPYASPSLAQDLGRLPPCYLRTSELDPLADEGMEYAQRLSRAGVPVELHHFPGTFHGFTLVGSASITRRARTEVLDVLRHRFDVIR